MSKRLEMLEKLVASGRADSFARYALALEYRTLARYDDALGAFNELRRQDPEYLPQYLMAGQMLIEKGRPAEAIEWLEQGRELARRKADQKTLGEIEAALASVA
jgi:tetratricopeptide (TPR) repeat protein